MWNVGGKEQLYRMVARTYVVVVPRAGKAPKGLGEARTLV